MKRQAELMAEACAKIYFANKNVSLGTVSIYRKAFVNAYLKSMGKRSVE
jgi:hypothetical protein